MTINAHVKLYQEIRVWALKSAPPWLLLNSPFFAELSWEWLTWKSLLRYAVFIIKAWLFAKLPSNSISIAELLPNTSNLRHCNHSRRCADISNEGTFNLFNANIARLQNLGKHGTQLYASLQGQYSPDNLEADGFSAGGPYTVSGYKSSVLGGSSGYYVITELRQNLLNSNKNQLLGKVYVDTAQAQFVANKWKGFSGSNKARINSVGLGLDWQNSRLWQAQARIGFPFGHQSSTVDDRNDVQAWLNVSKLF